MNWRNQRRLLLVVAGVVAALLLVELGMRGAGLYFTRRQLGTNLPEAADEGAFRVLCLGESTTAELFADKKTLAWPSILQRLLNKRSGAGKQYRVYNAAMPGLITSQMVADLDQQLTRYRPHVVVTMIGINDRHLQMRYTGSSGQDLDIFWHNIRIYQLARWLISAYSDERKVAPRKPRPAAVKPGDAAAYDRAVREAKQSIEEGRALEAERGLLRAAIQHPAAAARAANELYNQVSDGKDRALTIRIGLLKCRLEGADMDTLFHFTDDLVNGLVPRGNEALSHAALDLFVEYAASGRPVTPAAVSHFASVYAHVAKKHRGMDRILTQQRTTKNAHTPYQNTAFHYRAIHEQLQKREVTFVAMAYPRTNEDAIKVIFSGHRERRFKAFYDALQARYPPLKVRPQYRDVVFVSNRQNFEQALKREGWDALFEDAFGVSFGHATTRGHTLIADNLSKTILRLAGDRRR